MSKILYVNYLNYKLVLLVLIQASYKVRNGNSRKEILTSYTPCHYSIESGNAKIVELLLPGETPQLFDVTLLLEVQV